MSEAEQKEERKPTHLLRVIQEIQEASQGRTSRQELIRRIENHAEPRRKLLVYVANVEHPNSHLSSGDIVPLGDALASLGEVDYLDLVLQTSGGSGEVAEKFVEMCRNHCRLSFRVIVPNMAKSAGTLIALGADQILMGYCSELGPIDPQIRIIVGNSPQWISAWTFIRARNQLQEKAQKAMASGENPTVYLQQLAAIDPVFVAHCEQLMTFARQVVRKFVFRRQGESEFTQEAADKAVDFLCNVEEHISHGRLITAREIQKNSGPILYVEELPENNDLWQLLWELYVRCEVFVKMDGKND
jgi:hypothetical protein